MFKRISLLLVVAQVCCSLVNAQTLPLGVGYAMVTPQGSNLAAFTAVETLFNATEIGIARTQVGPAPILMNAALPVNIGFAGQTGTDLAFVNPSPNNATVNLSLSNALGVEIANRTISIAPGDQISQFVNSLFQIELTGLSSGLLKISSNVPVAILALDFHGVGFTSVPITNLDNAVFASSFTTTPLVAPATFGVAAATCGLVPTITGVTPAIIGVAPTTCTVAPGFAVAPAVAGSTRPVTTVSVVVPTTTEQLQPSVTTTGGIGAFVFPQVVTGVGTEANLQIGNTSSITQFVRFDLFSSAGDLIRSVSNIPVPPGGLVVFSSESDGIIPPQ